jgi:hypothetical protein
MKDSQFRAWSLLLITIVVVAAILGLLGRLQPVTQLDTDGYQNFPIGNLVDALNHQRTFFYPVVLKGVESQGTPFAIIPYLQFGSAAFAAGIFMSALIRCGWSSGLAFAASLPLLTNLLVMDYTMMVTPDLLAQSLAIIAIAFWLRIVWLGYGGWRWVPLSMLVFLAYQTKPAYLFLVAFVPVGGAIARWWLFGNQSRWLTLGIKLGLSSFVPFLGWCSFRWLMVSHFGLVAFGGYNVIGITGQLLRPDDLSRLSQEARPLANGILELRDMRVDWSTRTSYSVYESQYNPMVWEISVPAAAKLFDGDTRRMNLELTKLSHEVIRLRPVRYAMWLLLASKRAVTESVQVTLMNPLSILSILSIMFFSANNWYLGSRKRLERRSLGLDIEYQTMLWLAVGYAICSLSLVILVETPLSRYCAPASVFLSSLISMRAYQAYLTWQSLREGVSVDDEARIATSDETVADA